MGKAMRRYQEIKIARKRKNVVLDYLGHDRAYRWLEERDFGKMRHHQICFVHRDRDWHHAGRLKKMGIANYDMKEWLDEIGLPHQYRGKIPKYEWPD